MSRRGLILSGSSRKGGSSDILCDVFLRGAQDAGRKVEKIRVAVEKGVLVAGGAYEPGAVRNTSAMAQAYEMGRNA